MMASSYEDTVLDCLSWLSQTPNDTEVALPAQTTQEELDAIESHNKQLQVPSKIERQSKALKRTKAKIIATHTLINKFYANKILLEQTEKFLDAAKEECKLTCIDYKNTLEKCTKLEQATLKAQTTQEELDAIQSHNKQLQILVQELETKSEALKIENQLEKANSKNLEKKISQLTKELKALTMDIEIFSAVVFEQRKINKEESKLLKKYKKHHNKTCKDSFEKLVSEDESDDYDTLLSPVFADETTLEISNEPVQNSTSQIEDKITTSNTKYSYSQDGSVLKKDDADRDSDCSNEVVSVDTGRGSSLAFSDSDKCFHSPDYFVDDSPLSADILGHNEKQNKKQVDVATSPITVRVYSHTATSPIIFEGNESSNNRIRKNFKNLQDLDFTHTRVPIILIDKAVSLIQANEKEHSTTSFIGKTSNDIATNPIIFSDKIIENNQNNKSKKTLQVNENEVVSVDTGRGSSLAFSDSDKCFHSPDYFVDDSPLSADILGHNEKQNKKQFDVATSPITVRVYSHTATSPIIFEGNKSPNNRLRKNLKNLQDLDFTHTRVPIILIDKAVSPIQANEKEHSTTSFIGKTSNDIATSPVIFSDKIIENNPNNKSKKTLQVNETLELNSSYNLCDDNSNDCEIETILNKMRLNFISITPIPKTPFTSLDEVASSQIIKRHSGNSKNVYQDAAHAHISTQLADIQKGIMDIKRVVMPGLFDNDNENNFNEKSPRRGRSGRKKNSKKIDHSKSKKMLDGTLSESDEPLSDLVHNRELLIADTNESEVLITPTENNSLLNTSQKFQFDDETVFSISIEDRLIENDHNREVPIANCDSTMQKQKQTATKFTRLEKLRQKMLPKSKIKRIKTPPIKKLRSNTRQVSLNKTNHQPIKVSNSDTSSCLNDKEAYEKAVKFMTELRSKQKRVKTINNQNVDTNSKKVKEARKKKLEINETLNKIETDKCINIRRKSSTKSPKNSITTRSQTKQDNKELHEQLTRCGFDSTTSCDTENSETQNENKVTDINDSFSLECGKRRKRSSLDKPCVRSNRTLRSSTIQNTSSDNVNNSKENTFDDVNVPAPIEKVEKINSDQTNINQNSIPREVVTNKRSPPEVINYDDLDWFTEEPVPAKKRKCEENDAASGIQNPQESILCKIIEKHGISHVKNWAKKMSDSTLNSVTKSIEEGIAEIIKLPPKETKHAMHKFIDEIRHWNLSHFLEGLLNYLKDPERKTELISKVNVQYAPPMTKSEQVLVYVVIQLRDCWPNADIVNCVLSKIEYTLFQLGRTPEFRVIESMSHFYAVLCRYNAAKSRIRLFILDAMYCLQFKAIPLIKQCLDVWVHILPLAHMGIAKSPLVTCLVYLLHFYKCEDKFNRVNEIRNMLKNRYFYEMTDWNETKILDILKVSIKDIRDIGVEKKMLRLALIILAKRQGPKWCQNHIIKNMLQPMIERENMPDRVKWFCVSMIGPLLKPYPAEMKVYCEIAINQLLDMLDNNPSHHMKEAIFTSLISMNKHNQSRVVQALLSWHPKQVSPDMENLLRDYVKEKRFNVWKNILSKISLIR